MNLLIIPAAIVIVVHCLCMVAKLNHKNWSGHKIQFAFLALSYSIVFGGAVAFAIGSYVGAMMLIVGMAGRVLFDRRERA